MNFIFEPNPDMRPSHANDAIAQILLSIKDVTESVNLLKQFCKLISEESDAYFESMVNPSK